MGKIVQFESVEDAVPIGVPVTRIFAESIAKLSGEEHGPRFAFLIEGDQVLDFKGGAEDFLKNFPFISIIGRPAAGLVVIMVKQTIAPEEVRGVWDEECFGALFFLIMVCGFRGELFANDEAQGLIGTQLA